MINSFYGQEIPKHKVFVSFHSADEKWKLDFEKNFGGFFDGFVSKSVGDGDIDDRLPADTIRQKIRDEFIRDATVTIVLIGRDTWKRKHVDWEIGSSIRETKLNPRNGLIGLLLPSYNFNLNGINYHELKNTENGEKYNPKTIPPRLYNNVVCGFAKVYSWTYQYYEIKKWIDDAFKRRKSCLPDNSYQAYAKNRSDDQVNWQ